MQVILLKKVENLGALGNIVSVRPGYARNFLIPQGKAQMATKANMAAFEVRRAELEAEAEAILASAQSRRDQLAEMVLTIKGKAGNEGKLFGSVSNIEIAEAIQAAGINIERREIRMPDGAIRHLGEFEIGLHLHAEVDTTIKVVVESE
ncbi:MAG: ribosomal protein [Pseudomonadota bacterium]|jgi:large subunit ribosomal protein L9|uniref:Large ribosomal subunit protein bL9 n=1 Tax=Thiothrix fructosivorans TaxID=111770 RepID=A0A8B0SJT1_9GAMM|nr:50S ribosomal protein L9 [Thiothrix fructosivorans]MBO0613461.1 50S ribosomal protein L9 [Thiothrix fructosivorans]QTX11109.1 50S ribosomal protein L9 [Thiothrix fructosivorans]